MLTTKFVSYRLHLAGITQNKLKCLIFIAVPQVAVLTFCYRALRLAASEIY